MYAFVRFKKTLDGIFYAEIEPDFDVLPLISVHFEKRYADQQWLIYDVKRSYGIFYDIQSATTVMLEPFDENLMSGSKPANIMDGKEELYQILWQTYFNSVNVVERKNTKLQLRQMPKRYWKYLSELRRI
jgi:probable DNA metabolism protein